MIKLKAGNIYEVINIGKGEASFIKGKEYTSNIFAGIPALRDEEGVYYWGDELDFMGIELQDVSPFNIEKGKSYIVTDNSGADCLFKENKIYKSKIACNEPAIYSETNTPYWGIELKRMGIKLKELQKYNFEEGKKFKVINNNGQIQFKDGSVVTVVRFCFNPVISSLNGVYYNEKEISELGILLEELPPNSDYKFKVGQVYKVLSSPYEEVFKEGKEYTVVESVSKPALLSEKGSYYYDDDFGAYFLKSRDIYLKLVKDVDEQKESSLENINLHKPYESSDTVPSKTVETPTIEVPWLVDYINDNDLSSYDITHFLKGYMKGIEVDND